DVYALGCTLYALLTGRPPFPGGTVGLKLARHLRDEPPAVESLRPEVPPGLAAVVRKMMAKRREDRHQSAAAAAAALAARPDAAAAPPAPRATLPVAPAARGGGSTPAGPFASLREPEAPPARPRRARRWALAALALAALAGAGLWRWGRPTPTAPPAATGDGDETPRGEGPSLLDGLSRDALPEGERPDWLPPEVV